MEVRRGQFAVAQQSMKEAQAIQLQVFSETDLRIGVNYYNQACIAALGGDRRAAIGLLTQALATEWVDAIIFRDPDLDSLRDDPEFQSILAQVRARLDS